MALVLQLAKKGRVMEDEGQLTCHAPWLPGIPLYTCLRELLLTAFFHRRNGGYRSCSRSHSQNLNLTLDSH